ncbi:SCP-2 sterol transfer family protein [Mycobacterium sp. NPDC003449]
MAERVSSLLRRSVEHLAAEVPDSCRLMLEDLGPLVVALDVDGELFSLRGGTRLEVADGPAPSAGARVRASRTAILDVLDARVSLREAVEGGAVGVRGSLDDVLRAHDTLLAYVHAAVRAPSQPGLLEALRMGADRA